MGWLKYPGVRDACVYVLTDPRYNDEPRYVGKTVNPAESRRKDHIRETRRKPSTDVNYRRAWIRQLLSLGLEPGVSILESGIWPCDVTNAREVYWIAKLRGEGARLTNATIGGDGGFNEGLLAYNTRKWTDEERQRHSERMKRWAAEHKAAGGGFQGTEESKVRRSDARRRWHDSGGRAVMAERMKDAWADPEKRKNLEDGVKRASSKKREATLKRYQDPAERKRTSEAVKASWERRRNGSQSG